MNLSARLSVYSPQVANLCKECLAMLIKEYKEEERNLT